eukprot:TRINITY_DN5638_c0_g2_i1.p1 TRINITY_DN5638_c0_g2~~TRINITY_DN5638_c0_g2_i1.p1  ORF type:complete len:464 (-),score=27.79 TRINITY_DN5638_c0_g2_i1:1085-2371(-)
MPSHITSPLIQSSKGTTKNNCFKWTNVKQFFTKNFLTIGLLLALFVGLSYPVPGDIIASQKLQGYNIAKTLNICTIFFISGLTLRSSEIKAAFSSYCALAYSLVVILLITPFAGMLVLKVPYNPLEFAVGLAVFCAVPTTLTSGATLAMQANGNYALALMITVSSNVLGVLTVPFILKFVLEGVVHGLQIDALQLLESLLLTILLPLILGKIVRHCNKSIMNFGKARKTELSLINNGSLVLIVWQTISESQQTVMSTDLVSILLLVISGIIIHFVFFGLNFLVAKIVKWGIEEQRAVILIASQKTLPVAVTIISYFGAQVGNKGLITLPCILAYLAQLFIDSFIVSRWVANDAKLSCQNEKIYLVLPRNQKNYCDNDMINNTSSMQIQKNQQNCCEIKNGAQQQCVESHLLLSSLLDVEGSNSSMVIV